MRRLVPRKLGRCVLLLGLMGWVPHGLAQPDLDEEGASAAERPERRPGGLLSDRFGYRRFDRLLGSSHPEDRLLAYSALARQKNPHALEALRRALNPPSPGRDPYERLAILRIAARHAAYPSLRDEFARILSEPAPRGTKPPAPRGSAATSEGLLREVAALTLARYGGVEGEQILLRALHQPGPAARASAMALEAHPAVAQSLIERSPQTLTPEELEVLASRRNPAPVGALKRIVVEAPPPLQARALLALHRLQDAEVVPVAAYWLDQESASDEQHRVALEILADAGHKDWPRRAREGLASRSDRGAVIELLLRTPAPALEDELGDLVPEASAAEAGRLLTAVARTRSKVALSRLERWLFTPRLAPLAAFALSQWDGPAAERILLAPRRDPSAARWALRGAVLSARRSGVRSPQLDTALARLERSTSTHDRADAAWAETILEPDRPVRVAPTEDPARRHGATSALPLRDRDAHLRAAKLLDSVAPLAHAGEVVGVLGDDSAMRLLPQRVLEGLLTHSRGLARIAITELVRRIAESDEDRVGNWLVDPDPWFRVRVVMGLGLSRAARASEHLERAYTRELDPTVREAIIDALGRHGPKAPFATLMVAENLDPSPEVRDAARRVRLGLSSKIEADSSAGAWLALVALMSSSGPRGATSEVALMSGSGPRGATSEETVIRCPSGQMFALGVGDEALAVLTAVPPKGYQVRVQESPEVPANDPSGAASTQAGKR